MRRSYLNNVGQVLLGGQAFSFPPGNYHDDGLWASDIDGGLRLVAREGEPAPGTDANLGSCVGYDQDDRCSRPDYWRPLGTLGLE